MQHKIMQIYKSFNDWLKRNIKEIIWLVCLSGVTYGVATYLLVPLFGI